MDRPLVKVDLYPDSPVADRARRNLRAFAVEQNPGDVGAAAEWFRAVAEPLGLIAPPGRSARESGLCAVCGGQVPMWRAARASGGLARGDVCSRKCQQAMEVAS